MPILEYNGSATQSAFTLDSGSLGPGPEGVLLELKADQQAKISTTDYLMYGYAEATLRHDARQGLVAAFITMSDIKDEIDWEFTTANSSLGKTNYFWMGQAVTTHGTNVNPPNFNVSDWHTYGLNWTYSQLEWTIDGRVVRTVTRNQAGTSYPRSPSRIQFSTWAGGNATNPEGTIEWAGGPIDWTSPEYKNQGFYSQEIKQFNVQCGNLSGMNLSSISGSGNGNITSFVYTGADDTQTLEPAFSTSTAPLRILSDPGVDGIPGYPGFGVTINKSGSNGKGAKDGKDSGKGTSSNGGSSSGGNKDANGTTNTKDDAASSSGGMSSALKYALPISGAVIGLTAAWAIVAFARRRHLKAPIINAVGVTGVNDPRFGNPSSRSYARSITAGNVRTFSGLLEHETESSKIYRTEPNMNLMMGGGIMSDAGLSHLQRQTTGSSKLSRGSSRTIADRLLRNQSKRYQQLDAMTEEEEGGMGRHSMRSDGIGPSAYAPAAHQDEEDIYETPTRGYANPYSDIYSTPQLSPVEKNVELASPYHYPSSDPYANNVTADHLQSFQRRGALSMPVVGSPMLYTPNYTFAPQQQPQRPSGRLYDTPNVNYYPTPVMQQGGANEAFYAQPQPQQSYVPMSMPYTGYNDCNADHGGSAYMPHRQ